MSRLTRAVGLCTAAATLAACASSTVSVETHEMSEADAAACAELVDAVPSTLAGQERRPVDPEEAPGAAWGDPAYVLTCGAPAPQVPDGAVCLDVGGVGWWVPDQQLEDSGADVVATALTHSPLVTLAVPARYRGEGYDAALAELAGPVAGHLTRAQECI